MNNDQHKGGGGGKKPKVVIVFPRTAGDTANSGIFPLPALAVAAPLHHDGYEVVIMDERHHRDFQSALLDACDGALCVGVSTITGYQLKGAIRYTRLVRRHYPGCTVVWGGYHPSLFPDQVIEEGYADAVVRGQGELSFHELVGRLAAGTDLKGVAGVTYRDLGGTIVTNPPRPFHELDDLPPVPYELVDIERLFDITGKRSIQYMSSQGCAFHCAFCVEVSVYGGWKAKSAARVVDEIAALKDLCQMDHLSFSDANFFLNPKRVREICELLIERDLGITWSCTARADQVSRMGPEFAAKLRRSGCVKIGIGIESGSERILKLIDKRISPEDAYTANRLLGEVGIQGDYAFMTGFPKEIPESRDEVWQTLMLIKKIRRENPEVITHVFYFTPYPGTQMAEITSKLGLEMPTTTEQWSDWDSDDAKTDWLTPKEKRLVEGCVRMVFPMSFPTRKLKARMSRPLGMLTLLPLHKLSQLRSRSDRYGFPVEWGLAKGLKRLSGSG